MVKPFSDGCTFEIDGVRYQAQDLLIPYAGNWPHIKNPDIREHPHVNTAAMFWNDARDAVDIVAMAFDGYTMGDDVDDPVKAPKKQCCEFAIKYLIDVFNKYMVWINALELCVEYGEKEATDA